MAFVKIADMPGAKPRLKPKKTTPSSLAYKQDPGMTAKTFKPKVSKARRGGY